MRDFGRNILVRRTLTYLIGEVLGLCHILLELKKEEVYGFLVNRGLTI